MTAKNDVTGDLIKSKPLSRTYEENFDAIFRKQPVQLELPFDGTGDEPSVDNQRNTPLVGGLGFRRVDGKWVQE